MPQPQVEAALSGPIGVLFNTDQLNAGQFIEYAQKVEQLNFESLWLPELFTRDPFAAAGYLLAATKSLRLATGIANVYARDPAATVSAASTLTELSGGRFVLGLGVSNAALNKARGHTWINPVEKLRDYLQAMAEVKLTSPQLEYPVHVAAHGPKMLALVGESADGANTYLMPVEHVSVAREILGTQPTLNTMLFCLLEDDPQRARSAARKAVGFYVNLDYYQRAWRAQGFADADFADGGSDRLIDSIVAWGTEQQINARISEQFKRGATRVIVIPLGIGLKGHPDWTLLEKLAT